MSLVIRSRNTPQTFFEEARLRREASYQALHQIDRQQGKRKAKAFEKYYRTWMTFGGYRETPKHYVIKVIDLFRQRAARHGPGIRGRRSAGFAPANL